MAEAEFSQALEAAAHKAQVNRQRRSSTISTSFASRSSSFLAALLRPEVYKPFLILNGYFLFQQLSGTFVITYYAVDIVVESGVTGIDPYIATVFIGLVRLVICIGVSLGMKRLGRRAPSIISGAGMTVCMAALAIYVTLQASNPKDPFDDPLLVAGGVMNATEKVKDVGIAIPAQAWIPLIALLSYIALATLGFLTLPWAMMGEVFPNSVRGSASGLTSALAYIVSFGIIKAYPGMASALGAHGAFFVFCAFSLVGTIFVTLWLPETQGKRLSEIERDFVDGPCLQLCRKTKFGEKKKQSGPAEASAAIVEADDDALVSREMGNIVADTEVNFDEQSFETADPRSEDPTEDAGRGKPDV